MTAAQSGIWFAQQLDPANPVFNIGGYVETDGPVDSGLLDTTMRQVVAEALRAAGQTLVRTPDQIAVLARALSYAALRVASRSGRITQRALVCGAGAVGAQLVTRMREHPEYGLVPQGFVDRGPRAEQLPAPLLGAIEDLPRLIVEHDIDSVFLAFGETSEFELVDFLRHCAKLRAEIYCVPRPFELHDLSARQGANQGNGFYRFINSIAEPLALFFPGLFTLDDYKLGILLNYGLAAVFWLVAAGVIARIVGR